MFARPWLRRAERSARQENWFESLIYLWVSFNAWLGLAVEDRSYSENDNYLWKAAGQDPRFQERFAQVLASNNEYGELVGRFHSLWPIFKARALADEGIPAWGAWGADESRIEYQANVFAHDIDHWDFSPSCFVEHQKDPNDFQSIAPERIPLDWEHPLLRYT